MLITRDKVRAMFLLTAIGDALGMPVETWTKEMIEKEYGLIADYHDPKDHKWYKGCAPGTWTDDTQLTLAVARSLIRCKTFDMDDMANAHVVAMRESIRGWGGSTVDAVRKCGNGIHWSESGKTDKPNRGGGNGVVMKMAPLAVFLQASPKYLLESYRERILMNFTYFTHHSRMALVSTMVQYAAIEYILGSFSFNPSDFLNEVLVTARNMEECLGVDCMKEDSMHIRIRNIIGGLDEELLNPATPHSIVSFFAGSGNCYVYESLPVALYLVAKNPYGMDAIYEAASYGGDTDTIAAIAGALIGLINGTEIIPHHLISGLWRHNQILNVADKFCDTFGID
ncbi:ADP-ribosylglycohydrolase family protein [Patescibacteria group bacterium]